MNFDKNGRWASLPFQYTSLFQIIFKLHLLYISTEEAIRFRDAMPKLFNSNVANAKVRGQY
jgi:hypothetical protein